MVEKIVSKSTAAAVSGSFSSVTDIFRMDPLDQMKLAES